MMNGGLIVARVDGTPGPKGSLRGVCLRCERFHYTQKVRMNEQSEVGVRFRKLVARQLKVTRGQIAFTGPVQTCLTFYIKRQRKVKNGVELDEWVPTHQASVPVHHGSGDVEKHVRVIHDALQDAGVLADDQLVWRTVSEKLWADEEHPPGVMIEVRGLTA
jgi:Holliday junction resolvase RusA-like endonuclease